MGRLFRSVLGMIGGSRSGSPAAPEDSTNQKPVDTPFRAAFRVPGMS
jgi:hypothetical protein